MKENKKLKITGTILEKNQLEKHLEKIATNHNTTSKSQKDTYPIPELIESFNKIEEVYELLNEHVKLGIGIHPAGEWLLDNFYIIEEAVKQMQKELPLNKYINFVGISNGNYKGFARIYILASEIVAYSDNKIERESLEDYLKSYQSKKTLSMDEIWNIGLFLQIAIIKNIAEICSKIYNCQMQKYKAENIAERLLENKEKPNFKLKHNNQDMKYPFIEYMSYILKRYGKKANAYLRALEEVVEKLGTTVSEVIKKEHFDIANQKVLMGNSITSIKEVQRINFLEIFEKINGVEEILRQDPSNVYSKMDHKTKEYYRGKIKEISKKSKISEIYISRKMLELAQENFKKEGKNKKSHIGYYLIDVGINELYKKIGYIGKNEKTPKTKIKIYISMITIFSIIVSIILSYLLELKIKTIGLAIVSFILFLIPASEVIIQIAQTILNKIVKPKLIPKIDFSNGIDKENTSMVIIPTIVDSKEKVKEMFENLERYYLANKTKNLYFTLLGDCTQSKMQEDKADKELIQEGKNQVEKLNKKYPNEEFPIFNFLYRKREWNEKESSYLGWERKRGLINQFNEYLLHAENPFRTNTIQESIEQGKERKTLENIKYIITLDADTDLILNSATELVGAMAHILNTPVLDKEKNIVVEGYGIMQPRVGINLDISYKTLFTKIFAGAGGIDSYTNAISDIYQDNFAEGIFTGKGIYDLKVFSKVLKNRIPENKVLSHDLLEGCYLKCGLVSDIMLMDGYPCKYNSFMTRLTRWIRGDWQIIGWLKKNSPLNLLSKYKILDNLRRSIFEISVLIALIYISVIGFVYKINTLEFETIFILIAIIPYILEFFNYLIGKKEGEETQKTFTPKISGIKGILIRTVISLGCLPYKAYSSLKSICKTINRLFITHKNLLEWTTSEEAEKSCKNDLVTYFKNMFINIMAGIIGILIYIKSMSIIAIILGILWIITPAVMWYISKEKNKKTGTDLLAQEEKQFILEIGRKTWDFFENYLNEKNNYLIPDNYQEDRKNKIVPRTSSTNIGLSMLAVISANDLGYIEDENTITLLKNIIETVETLEKWNGHLYNWYNIESKKPLIPRYVSTVDSGNFVGYLYVVKNWLEERKNNEQIDILYKIVDKIIENTDFSYLYNKEQRIFSIGFNIEENKLTNSYYDLLASEARQASLVAIAKRDVPAKHWNSMSRTLTTLGKYKGLISWSGTSFEYLMPNINIPKYEGSLLDESCKFMIMSQMEYAKKLQIPWGISEAAFNLKDLNSNYQYKAFGIPWLGLKRGLADEMVVAPYGSVLAITDYPKEVYQNLKELEEYGMYGKYGFYESIDFTPERLEKGKKTAIVKTYMAHHQSLILLSINNLFNNKILQKRFIKNPEISAVSILLQERMPETAIITKENKEKVEKLKYIDYEDYISDTYKKIDERLVLGNVISNEDYIIAMNQKGEGLSRYKNAYINRYKPTEDYPQGIFFYVKNIKSKKIWSSNYQPNSNYQISFMPDKIEQETTNDNIKTKIKTIIAPDEPVEIRQMEIENLGNEEEILEITSFFEPVLSSKEQDYAHPAFNNLFLIYEFDYETNSIIVKRKKREEHEKELYVCVNLSTHCETVGDLEYEIDKEKFIGRGNIGIPQTIKNSKPLSKKIGLVTEPIVTLKRTMKVKPEQTSNINLLIAVGESKEKVIENIKKYKIDENIKKAFELSKAKNEAQSRYLRIKGEQIRDYQRILSYIIFKNPAKTTNLEKLPKHSYEQSELWKYGISGDLPIILVTIKDSNDAYVVKEVLKAYEFMRTKGFETEVVIIDEEKHSYENFVKEEIEGTILNSQLSYLKNIRGGIFELSKNEINKEDFNLLKLLSTIIIEANKGGIRNTIKDIEEEYLEKYKRIENEPENKIIEIENKNTSIDILENFEELKYYNEYGAFSEDGKEYKIKVNKNNRLPTVWSHILANEKFGTLVTENMGGYTWYKNSRLNRVTNWQNQPNLDIPSEIIYIKDLDNKKVWTLGLNPMPDDENYNVIYGFGYARYIHKSDEIEQELDVFVPQNDSIKIQILKLKNTSLNRKRIKLVYYAKPVLGEDDIKTNEYIDLNYDKNNNILCAKNLYNQDFKNDIIYVSNSEEIRTYTGDKEFFIGKGDIAYPDALKKNNLNNENSIGKKACIAYQIEVELESMSEKEIIFTLGAEESLLESKNISYKYNKVQNCRQELEKLKNYWKEILGRLQVYTPLESINIILNGWDLYQTIQSRLIAKTGFYQSGGAYGFRDQLQDTIALKYIDPEILRKQIIKHSKHQFLGGDVLHWWHEETERGIKTRFSDDLLWLVYLTCEYIEFTGDRTILDIETPYLVGKDLEDIEYERYDKYPQTQEQESIYNHCVRAIERSLSFGENGLPKIGSGDWNDGLSNVGPKGKGESVWLGFFLYNILDRFIPICKEKGEINKVEKYEKVKETLKKSLNTNGWDGRWFKRAFMDDGNILGSMANDECRIDSIAQSWSVISNAGDNDKKYISMESMENHLIDKENGIVKLLDPPFEKSKLNPGYIKSYLPGVRENGGQYTHAATWVIIAEAILGFGDKATEIYRMINPIEHSRTKESAKKYKVEPYVIPADIYGANNLAGRGGWTWYTGSSSWYYKAGIEYILGLKIKEGYMKIEPCISKDWKEYMIKYKWKNSIYNITIKNPEGKNTGVRKITVNGEEKENKIKLEESGIFNIEVIM